jgi:integrase
MFAVSSSSRSPNDNMNQKSSLIQISKSVPRVLKADSWLVMLLTGLRRGHALTVKWEHLDQDGVLSVPSPKGGEAKAFKMPLPRLLIQELGEVRDLTRPLESPFVFPSKGAKSGQIENMSRTKGFPYALHMMRHTYRTHAMEAGVDFQTVTLLLNHANPHV